MPRIILIPAPNLLGGFANLNAGGFAGNILDASLSNDKLGISQVYSYADLTNVYNYLQGSIITEACAEITNANFGGLIGQLNKANIDSSLSYNNITIKRHPNEKIGMIGTISGEDALADIKNCITAGISRVNNGNTYLSGLIGMYSSYVLIENVVTNRLIVEGNHNNLYMGGMIAQQTLVDISNSYSVDVTNLI